MKNIAHQIGLDFWQDPTSNLAIVKSNKELIVYCSCWTDESGEDDDRIGKIIFSNCWYYEYYGFRTQPYALANQELSSYIIYVKESELLSKITDSRLNLYPQWKEWDFKEYKHYIVQGENSYVQIIASEFISRYADIDESQMFSYLKQ